MSERTNIATHWDIAPKTVQRLWPLIDVYGRVERALQSATPASDRLAGALVGNAGAA